MPFHVLGKPKYLGRGTERLGNHAIIDRAGPVRGQHPALEYRVGSDRLAIDLFLYFGIHNGHTIPVLHKLRSKRCAIFAKLLINKIAERGILFLQNRPRLICKNSRH